MFETELGCPSFHGEKMLKSRGANTHPYCVPLDIAKRSDNAPFDNLSFRVLVEGTIDVNEFVWAANLVK